MSEGRPRRVVRLVALVALILLVVVGLLLGYWQILVLNAILQSILFAAPTIMRRWRASASPPPPKRS